ncbi:MULTISPECIES: hypothetical protein [Carnobacterium]|nr:MULTISPECIES: hypothetical protein [Carnobacterium]MDT1939840.1 hypothetical protein [Carnobacterium divergens]MDT1942278.1 hypothetical protein [Carnobacterium divergens]MDT1948084.1 hypothetical protein [Carnobacterium divergens]MDT1950564.1 hypothetical protein [Carnobacterium divergens]MDT1956480.1 hypothetical protein [Carnobacterium divergens]
MPIIKKIILYVLIEADVCDALGMKLVNEDKVQIISVIKEKVKNKN